MDKLKLALIDGDFICYYAGHVKKDEEPKPLGLVYTIVDNIVNKILKDLNCTHYLGAMTVGRNFRYDIFKEYKANRKNSVKPLYYKEIKQYLIEKWNFVYDTTVEADDIINCLKRDKSYFSSDENDKVLVSPDKDILGLAGGHLNPIKDVFVLVDEEKAYYNFWKSMITGDTADGIKGLVGKGEKFAETLFKNDEKDLFELVFGQYLQQYGEYVGVEQFYQNYKALKILDKCNISFREPLPVPELTILNN